MMLKTADTIDKIEKFKKKFFLFLIKIFYCFSEISKFIAYFR